VASGGLLTAAGLLAAALLLALILLPGLPSFITLVLLRALVLRLSFVIVAL
jgi:hypothetical protein